MHGLLDFFAIADLVICCATLFVLFVRRLAGQYKFVAWYLAVRIISEAIEVALYLPTSHYIEKHLRYKLYFWTYWSSYSLEIILGFGIIYSIYRLSMAPLPGLQKLGGVMFRWAAYISLAIAFAMAFGPHVTSASYVTRFISQLQQTESVLTLCLLLFVCVTITPIGLSTRSKVFGVCLGFGLNSTAQLVASSWFGSVHSLTTVFGVMNGVASCLSLAIWAVYFIMPEPKRRIIMLPTTSPFLRWNQISAALGDAPGYVALGTVTQDMFAPAELEMMRRASEKMTQAYGD